MQAPAPPRAGGAILAAAIIAGAVGGVIMGQPSIGLLIGAGLGLVILTALWVKDRSR